MKITRRLQIFLSTEDIATINKAFSQDTIDDVLKYLENDGSPFARKTLETLLKKPKSSLAVGFELMNHGAKNSIKNNLN